MTPSKLKRTLLAAGLAIATATASAGEAPESIPVQEHFDALGPTVKPLTLANGKVVHYIDEGPRDGTPMVFVGGNGTSVRVFQLTEFLSTLRKQLKLRVISVERNGFGQTAYDPAGTYGSYAAEVEAVLNHVGVQRFSAVAISGGGPYLAEVIARLPTRVRSIHMAAALSQYAGVTAPSALCALSDAQMQAVLRSYMVPTIWFGFAPTSAVHAIPGFQDTAYEDAARVFFVAGQNGDPAPLAHEIRLYCTQPVAPGSRVAAPAFLYYGLADTTVPSAHADFWQRHFPNVAAVRLYPGEGHDVQYRHWGQVLADVAFLGEKVLVCHQERSSLVRPARAQRLLERGASLDICAWQQRTR